MNEVRIRLVELSYARSSAKWAFFAGFVLAISYVGIVQDYMGLEGYIEHCRRTWLNIPWLFWISPIVCSLWVYLAIMRSYPSGRG